MTHLLFTTTQPLILELGDALDFMTTGMRMTIMEHLRYGAGGEVGGGDGVTTGVITYAVVGTAVDRFRSLGLTVG